MEKDGINESNMQMHHDIQGSRRYAYIVKLRSVSCFAVVILHTALAAAVSFEISDIQRMWTMLLRNLMLWSVPCFIMATGALLLDCNRSMTYKKLFSRYVRRILFCILVFTAIFEIFDLLLSRKEAGFWVITEYLYKVVTGKSWSHMWYLYMLLGLYLLLPFYRMIASNIRRQDMVYMMAVYFIFLSVLPMLREVSDTNIAFSIYISAVYPFYLFIGHFIHSGLLKIPGAIVWILLALSTAGLAAATISAYLLPSAILKDLLGSYSFPLTLIQSVCVFSLFAGRNSKTGNMRIWDFIDRLSFGVYLIHMMFLKGLFVGLRFNPYHHGGAAVLLPIAVIVFACSLIVVGVVRSVWGSIFRQA